MSTQPLTGDAQTLGKDARQLSDRILSSSFSLTSIEGTLASTYTTSTHSNASGESEFRLKLAEGETDAALINRQGSPTGSELIWVEDRTFASGSFVGLDESFQGKYIEVTEQNSVLYPIVEPALNNVLQTSSLARWAALVIVGNDIEDQGTQRVAGVLTHHYSFTASQIKADSADLTPTQRDLLKVLPSEESEALQVELWLSDSGQMVRALQKYADGPLSYTTTVNYTAYNEPVEIKAPHPDDVI